MKLINLTPKEINFYHGDGRVETLPSSGKVIVRAEDRQTYMLGDYPVVEPSVDPTVGGLPSPPKDGEIPALIVARFAADPVARLWPGEVLVADTSSESAVRDEHNHWKIIGIRRWERWTEEDVE